MRRRYKSTGDLNYLGGGNGRESLPRFSSRGVGLQPLQESLASPVAGRVKQKYVALLPISIDISVLCPSGRYLTIHKLSAVI